MKCSTLLLFFSLAATLGGCGDGHLYAAFADDPGVGDTGSPIETEPEDTALPSTESPADTDTDTGTGLVDTDTVTDSDTAHFTVGREAETFDLNAEVGERAWYVVSESVDPGILPDPDASHAATASGGAYLEALPDARLSDTDTDWRGLRTDPANAAKVGYNVDLPRGGRYYIWVRGYTTGGQDNTLHVGFDDTWPDSGVNIQFPSSSHAWVWSSNQRNSGGITIGLPNTIYLDLPQAGVYQIQFAMREDGCELDAWIMTTDPDFVPL